MAKVLLADDEPDVAELLRFMLERDGHEVVAVRDGREALARLGLGAPGPEGAWRPDLILLDVMMPVLDGWSVQERLERDPGLRDVPVVILTARGSAEPRGRAANVAATLEKPFDPGRLRELVRGLLERP